MHDWIERITKENPGFLVLVGLALTALSALATIVVPVILHHFATAKPKKRLRRDPRNSGRRLWGLPLFRRNSGNDPIAQPFHALSESQRATFVGREPEMKQLKALLERANTGSGTLIFLTGEPGSGKTALSEQFLECSQESMPDVLICRGRCVEQYGAGEAFLPFFDALGAALCGRYGEGVKAALRLYAPTWCMQLPTLFSSSVDLEELQRETIGATKERMMRELEAALTALSTSNPVILFIEDLHWADRSSIQLVRHLSESAAQRRLLLIGTYRVGDVGSDIDVFIRLRQEMQAHRHCLEIPLTALTKEQIKIYLDRQFAPNDFPNELADLIHRKTEGHALFATELALYLAARNEIRIESGRWTLDRPLSALYFDAPESVRGMISRKMDAIDKEDCRILTFASVEGEEFTSSALAGLLEVDELALEESLTRLDKTHALIKLIGEDCSSIGSRITKYKFAHALYQSMFYERLCAFPKRRALLHQKLGEELVRIHGLSSVAAQVAMHFEIGRNVSRAIEARLQASENSTRHYDVTGAVEHLGNALRLSNELPGNERVGSQLVILERRGRLMVMGFRFAEAEADFAEMGQIGRAVLDKSAECRSLLGLATVCFWTHRIEELGARTIDAARVAGEIGSRELRLESMMLLAQKHIATGSINEAERLFEKAIEEAKTINQAPALTQALVYRGTIHFFQSEYQRAIELLRQARCMATDASDGLNLSRCLMFISLSQANLGKLSDALATVQENIELSQKNGVRRYEAILPNILGWIYREIGSSSLNIQNNRISADRAREAGIIEAHTNALVNLAHDYLQAGDEDRARTVMEEAKTITGRDTWYAWRFDGVRRREVLAIESIQRGDLEWAEYHAYELLENATRQKARKYMALAHALLADIATKNNHLPQAEIELVRALDILREYDIPIVAWKIHATLGRLRKQTNDLQGARSEFVEAADGVHFIEAGIFDAELRAQFLDSPAVRSILDDELIANQSESNRLN